MAAAIEKGVDLMGYTSWAFIDLISASTSQIAESGTGSSMSTPTTWGPAVMTGTVRTRSSGIAKVIASNGTDLA